MTTHWTKKASIEHGQSVTCICLIIVICLPITLGAADDGLIRPADGEANASASDAGQMRFKEQRIEDAWKKWPAGVRRECVRYFKGATVLKLKDGERRSFLIHTVLGMPNFYGRCFKATLQDGSGDEFKAEFWRVYRLHTTSDEPNPIVFLSAEDEHRTSLPDLPPNVRDAARKLGPGIEWNDAVGVEKEEQKQRVFKLKGRLNDKTVKAELFEDGSVKKSDDRLRLPDKGATPALEAERPGGRKE